MQIKHCHSPQRTVYFFSAIREVSSWLCRELIALQMRFVAAQKYSIVRRGQKPAEVTKARRGVPGRSPWSWEGGGMSSAGQFPPRAGSQSTCGSRHEAGSVNGEFVLLSSRLMFLPRLLLFTIYLLKILSQLEKQISLLVNAQGWSCNDVCSPQALIAGVAVAPGTAGLSKPKFLSDIFYTSAKPHWVAAFVQLHKPGGWGWSALGWEKQLRGRKGWLWGNVIPSRWQGKVPAVGWASVAYRLWTASAFIEMGAVILQCEIQREVSGFFPC